MSIGRIYRSGWPIDLAEPSLTPKQFSGQWHNSFKNCFYSPNCTNYILTANEESRWGIFLVIRVLEQQLNHLSIYSFYS